MQITLRNKTSGLMLWALGLDGARKEQLAVSAADGAVRLTVNTATLTNGPTPFFELATQ